MSAPAEKSHGCVGWNTQSMTPSTSRAVCARKIFSGTMSAFWFRSALTAPWSTCTVASSEAVANSGYFLWNATARTPLAWLAITLYGMLERSMSNHCSLPSLPPTMTLSPPACAARQVTLFPPATSFFTRHCLCRSYRYTYAAVQMNITGRFGWNSAARIGVFCCRKIRCDERLETRWIITFAPPFTSVAK